MSNNPLLLVAFIAASVWLARLWVIDFRAALAGNPNVRSLPGATPAPAGTVAIASLGALFILAAQTGGEHLLGVSAEQSTVTALFGLYSIVSAPMIEEVIFRGYLVIENRGRSALWAGVVGASLLFALLHPLLWEWNDKDVAMHFGAKGWFSTALVFTLSLWFYTVRVSGLNPQRSLFPCFVAHATNNLGVVVVKYIQGFVDGWW